MTHAAAGSSYVLQSTVNLPPACLVPALNAKEKKQTAYRTTPLPAAHIWVCSLAVVNLRPRALVRQETRYEITPQPHARSARQRGCEAGDNPITVLPTPGNLEHEPCPNCTLNTFRHETECSRSALSRGIASKRSPRSKLTNYSASGLPPCLWKSIRQMERRRSVSALERISNAQSSAQRSNVALVLEQLASLLGSHYGLEGEHAMYAVIYAS